MRMFAPESARRGYTGALRHDILFGSYSGKVAFETKSRSHRMMSAAPDRSASLTIGNTIGEMEKVAAFVDRFGADQRIPQSAVNDLNVCLDELLNNTISYGYDDRGMHNISPDPPAGRRPVDDRDPGRRQAL